MGSPELLLGAEAALRRDELATTYEGLKISVTRYSEAMGKVNDFLDRNKIHDTSGEGLDHDVNELYQFWRRSPDAQVVEDTIRLKV